MRYDKCRRDSDECLSGNREGKDERGPAEVYGRSMSSIEAKPCLRA